MTMLKSFKIKPLKIASLTLRKKPVEAMHRTSKIIFK